MDDEDARFRARFVASATRKGGSSFRAEGFERAGAHLRRIILRLRHGEGPGRALRARSSPRGAECGAFTGSFVVSRPYREQSERLGTPRNPRRSFDNDAPLLLSVCRSRRARSGCVQRALSALPALCLARAGHRRGAWSARLRGPALRHPRKSLLLDSTSARRERSPSCSTSTRTPSPGVEAMRTTSFPTPRVRTRRSRIPRRGWTASAIP